MGISPEAELAALSGGGSAGAEISEPEAPGAEAVGLGDWGDGSNIHIFIKGYESWDHDSGGPRTRGHGAGEHEYQA